MSSSRRGKSAATARSSEELGASAEVASSLKNKEAEEAPAGANAPASGDAKSKAKLEFSKDEQILCYHGPLLYEAKVLKAEVWSEEKLASQKQSSKKTQPKGKGKNPDEDLPGPRYHIHYKGWKQRWDEWVTASRILKWTPSNLELQIKLNENMTNGKPRKATTAAASATTAQSTSSPKSPTPSKPSPLASRTARSSLKPETPQVAEPSPSVATPEVSAPIPASRPKRKIPEATGFRSKRLQAIRSQQAAAESPKNVAPEPEPTTRLRSNANKASANNSESESLSETSSESEKLSSSASDTPIAPAPPVTKAKPTPAEPQRNKRKIPKEEPPVQSNLLKQSITPIWDGPPRLELPIPDELKIHLIDQWDLISRCQELIPLPRNPSVRQILADYREHAIHAVVSEPSSANVISASGATQEPHENEMPSELRTKIDVINEVVDGIALYFSKALGSFLLYRFERPQHARLLALYPKARLYFQNGDSDSIQEEVDPIAPNSPAAKLMKSPTATEKEWDLLDIYGAEHLLRLFAYLPKLLSRSDLDEQGLSRIKVLLEDMLTYLSSRKNELFLDQFETAPPSYTKIVKME
ncbi:Esa1p-associated factor [Entomophthora muscae]|uniref:Esa1p-associated factor n=1 Tax=Entomophthora muscae TaxID=34485 RepID=A0ACC2UA86_9FUNG|nr:Esa1p-associated factor [Entomophthora muscae]